MMGRVIGCFVIGIIFGLLGIPLGFGFFNYGFILMMLLSIFSLIITVINICKEGYN